MPRHPYLCYMLVGKKWEHSKKFYIGCTNNLPRRIRQHNGKLKSNNAKYTSKFRPWKVVATLRYCASQNDALKLEWAWQNPHRSRHLKEARAQGHVVRKNSIENSLIAAAFLANSKFYKKHNISLHLHNVSEELRLNLESLFVPTPVQPTAATVSC